MEDRSALFRHFGIFLAGIQKEMGKWGLGKWGLAKWGLAKKRNSKRNRDRLIIVYYPIADCNMQWKNQEKLGVSLFWLSKRVYP